MRAKKRTSIAGQFIAHRIDMLRSPAWAALSHTARRILDRLEIEHADHGGVENGKLPCTYDDFERFGVRRKSVADGIKQLEAYGFVEVMLRGRKAAGEFYAPSLYRLTYLPTKHGNPTDDWSKVVEAKNVNPGAETPLIPGAKTPLKWPISRGENAPTVPGAKTPLLSISRVLRTISSGERSAPDGSAGASEPRCEVAA